MATAGLHCILVHCAGPRPSPGRSLTRHLPQRLVLCVGGGSRRRVVPLVILIPLRLRDSQRLLPTSSCGSVSKATAALSPGEGDPGPSPQVLLGINHRTDEQVAVTRGGWGWEDGPGAVRGESPGHWAGSHVGISDSIQGSMAAVALLASPRLPERQESCPRGLGLDVRARVWSAWRGASLFGAPRPGPASPPPRAPFSAWWGGLPGFSIPKTQEPGAPEGRGPTLCG